MSAFVKVLYLFRHAKSSWNDPTLGDLKRPLKRRGVEACATIAAYMRRQGIVPDLVICSTARRARHTLELVSRHLGQEFETRFSDALYMASAAEILAELRVVDDATASVMVVGHNPGLAELAHGLVRSGEPAALDALANKFPTAALASLELDCESWAEVAPGGARLVAFATPKGLA